MEHRVRDLDQLQEQDTDRRKRGSLAMAALAILALAFAIGLVVGKAALPAAPERDPLDQLDRVLEAARRDAAAAAPPSAAKPSDETAVQAAKSKPSSAQPAVEAAQLTFERSLTEVEERPEVLAALEAAGREEERMAIHTAAPTARAPEDRGGYEIGGLDGDDEASPLGTPRVVPAGVAAYAAGQKLEKSKAHDKLVAASLSRPTGRAAARGSDGEFTLQVISYDSSAAAEAFASALRARGHEAFVTTGEIEGRGRVFRVRVGPFKTMGEAQDYRKAFEDRERMNTIVVRRQPSAK
jgi:cell division septation protein DedD